MIRTNHTNTCVDKKGRHKKDILGDSVYRQNSEML